MKFEWDPVKDPRLRRERSIGFAEAETGWADPDAIEIEAETRGEPRWAPIARVHGKIHTIVFTRRAKAIRLITIRRAHLDEVQLYEEHTQTDDRGV